VWSKRGFSLLELLAAVLIGSLIMLMIAGALQTAVRSWESVQERVSESYNRRNALDLIKRQTSSLFYQSDGEKLEASNTGVRSRARALRDRMLKERGIERNEALAENGDGESEIGIEGGVEFALPDGAQYFQGNIQELNFLSTVSFLSDFPGQVAVRYYVVQGEPEDGGTIADLVSSRTENEIVDDGGELMAAESLQGGLYLMMEEKNLFLAAAMDEGLAGGGGETEPMGADDFDFGMSTGGGSMGAGTTMRLLGPLRDFRIGYMNPARQQDLDAEEGEDDWVEVWDVESQGTYPLAVRFDFFYEEPGRTDDLPLEELDQIRLTIPIYNSDNLRRGAVAGRGGVDGPF